MNVSPMTRLLAAFFVALFLAAGLPAFAESEEVPPSLIRLRQFSSGWEITVAKNGSGNAQYGSSGKDFVSFPKGTVDFEALLKTARSREKVDSANPERIRVMFVNPGEIRILGEDRAMAGDWDALCRQIQPHLRSVSPEHLNKLIQKESDGEESSGGPCANAGAEATGLGGATPQGQVRKSRP
jgi:hypothetical protein